MTVYLYDQFGAGRSDRPTVGDFDRYTVEHYREEVKAVRTELDAESVALLGSSWGGRLAQEYILHYQENVSKFTLSSTRHDTSDAIERMKEARREELSEEELETMQELKSKRKSDDPEFQELLEKVYAERLLRVEQPNW